MLKRLLVKNFTVFAEADFKFGPGLNVVVGTNGTGKSHVLKLGYALLSSLVERLRAEADLNAYRRGNLTVTTEPRPLYQSLTWDDKVLNVFRPVPFELNELIRREAVDKEAFIEYELDGVAIGPIELQFTPGSFSERYPGSTARLAEAVTGTGIRVPVFIPAKEILTLSWMLPVASQLRLPLDETYLDLLSQLSRLPLRTLSPVVQEVISSLIQILGGEVEQDGSNFYLTVPKQKRLEMNMVAEGLRKFGTLQKLLANGSFIPEATLFWDEPEANLNPALLKKLAAVLAALARQGFQIILATHSLFLLKELHILSRQPAEAVLPIRYFGLNAQPGEATHVTTVDDFEDLPDIVALDVTLEQGEEFLNTLNEPNANV